MRKICVQNKKRPRISEVFFELVGVTGIEPVTPTMST